jgi:glycosyltransferase involved in cell wall biosynthesis
VKVAWLFEFPTLLGGERSLLAGLAFFRQQGIEPVALGPDGPLADALRAGGVPLVGIAFRDAAGNRPSQTLLRAELAEALMRLKPQVVHANSLAMGRLAGPVLRELGLPGIGHLRDIVSLSRQAVADLNCLDRILAVSHAARDFHLAQGVDATKTRVLYNGVDLAEFAPRPATGWLHAELGIPRDAQLVGTIGQVVARKGLDQWALAARVIAAEYPHVHFVIVGERFSNKPEALRFEQRVRQAFACEPLAGRGHFVGTRCDVPRLMNELTILVHAARQEPLGRVLLEAAASGLPIVASNCGGTLEIFPPAAHAAIVVGTDAPADLAAAVRMLLDQPGQRAQLSAAARRRAEAAFDARQSALGLLQHYLEVAGG